MSFWISSLNLAASVSAGVIGVVCGDENLLCPTANVGPNASPRLSAVMTSGWGGPPARLEELLIAERFAKPANCGGMVAQGHREARSALPMLMDEPGHPEDLEWKPINSDLIHTDLHAYLLYCDFLPTTYDNILLLLYLHVIISLPNKNEYMIWMIGTRTKSIRN